MKYTFIVLAFIVLICGIRAQEPLDKIIATVGGEPVLLSDLAQQLAYMRERQPNMPADAACSLMENLLVESLLLNQAKLDSIEVKDEEIDSEVNVRVEEILRYMGNDEAQFQTYYGKTVPEVRNQMREPTQQQILVRKMRQEILSSITVTPSEVREFYNKIPRDSLPYFSSEVELGEIVFTPVVNPAQKKVAFDKLTELRRRITLENTSFAELAEKYSADPGSARNGGDLGVVKRGTFVPEFEAAAYNLDKDEISPVIESDFGFHVIQLIDRKGNNIHCRHILIKPDITNEDLVKAKSSADSIRNMLMTDTISFSAAVKKYSDKKSQSYNNDGLKLNPKNGSTYYSIADLDPDVYFAIDKMKDGSFSAPVELKEPDGSKQYSIFKLISRSRPHKASLEEDYTKIAEAALEQKKGMFLIEWLTKHTSDTHIEVDEGFSDCGFETKWGAVLRN